MDSKGCTPYTNPHTQYNRPIRLYKKNESYIHIHNAPYLLMREEGQDNHEIYTMHLYEINKSKHHSLRKEDNPMIIKESNDAWTYISTIKSKKWFEIKMILYSKKDDLLWFIYRQNNKGYYSLMAYSIEHKKSLCTVYIYNVFGLQDMMIINI